MAGATRPSGKDGVVRVPAPPGSQTALAAVVGMPVGHSRSPALHNAGFAAAGLDWVFVAFEVSPARLAAAVEGACWLGVRGLAVTTPHKGAAAALASVRSPLVERLGAANTLRLDRATGEVRADSTDGDGFLADLREGAAFEPEGRRCAVLGAGGAARSVILALADAGAAEIVVVNRSPAGAERAASLAPGRCRVGEGPDVADVDLVVQATPVGMRDGPAADGRLDPGRIGRMLGAGQLAYDLVYEPPSTPFLDAAAASGAAVRDGLGMLVHQAARQFWLFTGVEAPLGVLWEAATGARASSPTGAGERERAAEPGPTRRAPPRGGAGTGGARSGSLPGEPVR